MKVPLPACALLLLRGAAGFIAADYSKLKLDMRPEDFRASTGQKIETYEGNFTFSLVHEERVEHPMYPEKVMVLSSFKSPPMKLKKGGTWFSLPSISHLDMPNPKDASGNKVSFAITNISFDMQDDTGRSVPDSEVYLHHWLMYDEWVGGSGDNLGCGGSNTWVSNTYGAGDEMRGVSYEYPKDVAQVSGTAHRHWSGNLHFIRTEDLIPGSLKKCAECTYQKGKASGCAPGLESYDSFLCCMQNARCPTNNPDDHSTKTYFLTYNMIWTTDNVASFKPIHVKVIDALNCAVTHSVGPNQKKVNKGTVCSDTLCESTVTRKIDESGEIIWAYCHIHIGATTKIPSSTLWVNGEHVCDSTARMGTDPNNTPGNEKGLLVGFEMCLDKANPDHAGGRSSFRVKKGDELKVTARINVDPNDDRAVIAGGEHRGQMALFYFYLVPDHDGPTPVGPSTYVCNAGMCTAAATGGGTRAQCEAMCGDQPVPPAPVPPTQKYTCVSDLCVVANSGVDLPTCQLAC